MAGQRLPGLDVVRGLAIVLVMVGHGALLATPAISPQLRSQLLYQGGYLGVELFFALSGFLIVGGLLRQLDKTPTLGRRAITTFWQRRWWRTLPNYAVFLCLNATLFAAWFHGPVPDARYVLFLQNLAWPHPPAMPEAWSLAVEEWFYLLLPLLLALSLLILPQPRKAVPVLLVLWVAAGALARLVVALVVAPEWDEGMRKVALLRLDGIAWGGLAACWLHYRAAQAKRLARALYWVGLVGLIASSVWLALGVVNHFQPVMNYAGLFTLTGASAALCLPWAAQWRSSNRCFTALTGGVSRISYSLYLVHFSFALPLMQLPLVVAHAALPWRLLGYVVVSLIVSYLAYRVIETPALALRDRLVRSP